MRGIGGLHLYILIEQARSIPETGQAIFEKLVLHGHGRIETSKAGTLLRRSLVDAGVWQPERLDFTRANCGEGLEQRFPEPQFFGSISTDLFAPRFLTTVKLTASEHSEVARKWESLESDSATRMKAKECRSASALEQARRRLPANASDSALHVLAEQLANDLKNRILPSDLQIRLQSGNFVTVQAIASDPKQFDGVKCADPIEHDYGDGKTVGIIQTNRYPPYIKSLAHGGETYYLFDWEETLLADFDDLPADVEELTQELRKLKLDDVKITWAQKAAKLGKADRIAVRDVVAGITGQKPAQLNAQLAEVRSTLDRAKNDEEIESRADGRALMPFKPEDQTNQAIEVEQLVVKRARPGEYVCFSGQLAQVIEKELPYAHQIDNPDGKAPPVLQIDLLNDVSILRHVESAVVFFTESRGHKKAISVPSGIVEILRNKTHHAAPKVTGLVPHPIVLRDGSILALPGLDKRTGLFVSGNGLSGAQPFQLPEAREALARLRQTVLEGFDFQTPLDGDVALAALLTGIQRRLLDMAPGWAVLASTQSSGKTTLARIVHILLTGCDMPATAFPNGDETEMQKRLLATLQRGPAMVTFDNIPDGFTFRSASLASALTSPSFSQRVLGSTREVEYPTNTLFVLTGNNLSFGADELSRWLVCRLAPKTATPETRSFKNPDVLGHTLRIRDSVLRDAIGLIAGYRTYAANSIAPSSRYHHWDAVVRQPLIWAGASDIAQVFDSNSVQSDERNAHRALLATLLEKFGGRWFSARQVSQVAFHHDGPDELAYESRLQIALETLRTKDVKSPRSVGVCLNARLGQLAAVGGKEVLLEARPDSHTGSKEYRVAGYAG